MGWNGTGAAVPRDDRCCVADRFRELERPQSGRLKDIVLMATVSSYESLRYPQRSDLRQFAELFEPLYLASSDEARRQAVAALSRCPQLPEPTALFIGCRPIGIAAIFLTGSTAITDRTLIRILKATGPDHARAIGRRDNLSPAIIEALVGSHQDHRVLRSDSGSGTRQDAEALRVDREEKLREEIRALALAAAPKTRSRVTLVPASGIHQALFVRFARAGETGMLSVSLADALGTSQWLSERILLDVSGRQLAETLVALCLPPEDTAFILSRTYTHLTHGGAETLVASLDPARAIERVESWQRADSYTNGGGLPEAANIENTQSDGLDTHDLSSGEGLQRAG
jgi:uncharacterized protein (DUF2336 family)